MKEFCKDVRNTKFKEQVTNRRLYVDVKAVCRDCMLRLKFLSHYFIPTYGPGAFSERIEIPKKFYKDALKPEDFEVYVKWIVGNLPKIWKSYKQMLAESLDMTTEQLKTDTKVGPLKYGFVLGVVCGKEVLKHNSGV
ncbi:secreted antigen 1 [Babesia divergens]|uniref:Secreted antigen 1 n=1 Tax=Babesia divergens TaxID=32595 RepID=A0AAD9G7X8_BABDI|nr:secreted antigen 1 [Babesia divergens]